MISIRVIRRENRIVVRKITKKVNIQARAKRGLKGEKGDQGDPATNLVTSVNGKQGVVVLSASDIDADAEGAASGALIDSKNYTDEKVADINVGVQSIVAGNNITVNATDPANPIVSSIGGGGEAVTSVNGRTGDVTGLAEESDLNLVDEKSNRARTDTLITPRPSSFIYIDPLNTLPGDYYGAGTASIVTESVDGGGSLMLGLPSGGGLNGRIRDSYTTPQDWSKKNFSIWVRSTNWSQVNEVQLLLLSGSSYTDNVAFRLNIKQYLVAPPNNEWVQLIFNREQFTTVGAAVWTNIQKVIYRGTATGANTPDIYFDSFQVFNESPKGIISLNFDDAYESVMDAARYMSTKGLVGSLFVIPSLLGTSGYMTQADVDYLARQGWEISGHAATNLATLTLDQVDEVARDTKKYLIDGGYKGADVFAYPEGVHNYNIRKVISKYFAIGRDTLFISQPSNYISPYTVHSFAPTADTLLADLTQRVTDAQTKGTLSVFCLHKVVASPVPGSPVDMSTADFEALIDAIAASGVPCLPLAQAINISTAESSDTIDTSSFATKTGVEALTNKTLTAPVLTAPTISGTDMANMNHTHQSPTSGGVLPASAIGSGAISVFRGGTNMSAYAQGDMLYSSAANVLARLAKSTNANQVLTNDGTNNNPVWSTINKSYVGLGNVNNTSDADKPVSTAQQTALNLKANSASPTFTGTPIFPATITANTFSVTFPGASTTIVGRSTVDALTNKTLTSVKLSSGTAPATATSSGTTGQIEWDANYVYVCTATNTWKRTPLTTW